MTRDSRVATFCQFLFRLISLVLHTHVLIHHLLQYKLNHWLIASLIEFLSLHHLRSRRQRLCFAPTCLCFCPCVSLCACPRLYVSAISSVSVEGFSAKFCHSSSWDEDELIRFWGQRVKGHIIAAEASSSRDYRRVRLFSFGVCVVTLCDFDANSRQDEEHHSELSAWLWFVCRQENDALREHSAWEVSCLLLYVMN